MSNSLQEKKSHPHLLTHFLESKLGLLIYSGHNVAVGWCVYLGFIFTFNILAEKTKDTFTMLGEEQIAPLFVLISVLGLLQSPGLISRIPGTWLGHRAGWPLGVCVTGRNLSPGRPERCTGDKGSHRRKRTKRSPS